MKYTIYKFADGHTAVVTGKWKAWQVKNEEAIHGKCLSKTEHKL